MPEVLEAVMLICFGVSWPVSVYKSWKSGSTGGKSLLFLLLIDFGYVAGLAGKILFRPSPVIVVYCINLVFVITDIVLFLRNRRRETVRAAQPATSHSESAN
ncbi:MAG: hypothetical protein LBS36_12845 [Oscillospiraceae bacterium]|nr:hypothetical protein [Oscillospiraceae bacterium]